MATGIIGSIAGGAVEKLLGPDIEKWIRFALSCAISWFLSFTGVLGIEMAAGVANRMAVGLALSAGAVALLSVCLRNPVGKTLWIVVPGEVQEKYAEGGMSVSEGKK